MSESSIFSALVKNIFLSGFIVFLFSFYSCSNCGHCIKTTREFAPTGSSTVDQVSEETTCDEDEVRAGKINCDRWVKESFEKIDPEFRHFYDYSSIWIEDN